jgi:hypothetical protein
MGSFFCQMVGLFAAAPGERQGSKSESSHRAWLFVIGEPSSKDTQRLLKDAECPVLRLDRNYR